MTNFKRVIEIENKYNHQISNSQKKLEKEEQAFISDLNLKEEVVKEDFKKQMLEEYTRAIETFTLEGENMLKNAKDEVLHIEKNSDTEKVVFFVLEELKNV